VSFVCVECVLLGAAAHTGVLTQRVSLAETERSLPSASRLNRCVSTYVEHDQAKRGVGPVRS
jgi:hypothetical protein